MMDFKYLLTSLDGKIGRKEFWIGVLCLFMASVVGNFALSIVMDPVVASSLVSLILIFPGVAVQVKRWHDRGKSGWWVLVSLVPVIGWIWVIVECGFLPGKA